MVNLGTMTPATLRRLIWVLNVVLLGGVAWLSATTLTAGLGGYLDANRVPPPQTGGAASQTDRRPSRDLAEFAAIEDVNIFGARRAPVRSRPVQASPVKAGPVSRAPAVAAATESPPLSLQLTGTFLSPARAFAMIVGPDGRTENLYEVGECVPSGGESGDPGSCAEQQGKLSKIVQDQVTVLYQGRSYTYGISDEPPEGAKSPAKSRSTARSPREPVQRRSTAQRAGDAADAFPFQQDGNTFNYDVPQVEVDKAFENFSEILKQARVVPYSENGKTLGFQIRQIRNGSIFQRIGLQNQDVIKGVNGESVTNADQALRLFTLFRNEREIVLDIARDKQDLQLAYTIN